MPDATAAAIVNSREDWPQQKITVGLSSASLSRATGSPWPTVYGYFAAWRDDGTLARLHDALRAQVRAAAGRSPAPTAAVIDSQSVPRRRHRAQGQPRLG